jgi:hypothetical protein
MRAAPTPALAAALVLGTTVLATIDALAAATLVDVLQTPLLAHRVEQAVALVAPLATSIPILLTRIRRPLPNASCFAAIVACQRKPVSMPPCFMGCDSTDDDDACVYFSLLLSLAVPYFLGAYRTSYLEGYLLGGLYDWRGLFLCFFCAFLSFLSPWMDQLSFRYQMVYAIYLEIIIPIPYSIFHTLCYM